MHFRLLVGPQQQQITQPVQRHQRLGLDLGEGLALHIVGSGHGRHRIAFREAAAEARGDQQIANLDVGVARQVAQLQLVQLATAGGDGAQIVAQHPHRDAVAGVGDEQDSAGGGTHVQHLADHPLIVDHRLAVIDAIQRPLVDQHLMAEGVGIHRQQLGHHLAGLLVHRRTEQFAQPLVLMLQLIQLEQAGAQGEQLLLLLLGLLDQAGSGLYLSRHGVEQGTGRIGDVLQRADQRTQIDADVREHTEAGIRDDGSDRDDDGEKQP